MSFHAWVFVAMCAAVLIPWAICGMFGRINAVHAREDATYPRTPGIGDLSTVAAHESTPIYDQLAAERVIAAAALVVAEVERGAK